LSRKVDECKPLIAGIAEDLGAVYTAVASNVLAAGLNPDSSPADRVAFISKSTAAAVCQMVAAIAVGMLVSDDMATGAHMVVAAPLVTLSGAKRAAADLTAGFVTGGVEMPSNVLQMASAAAGQG
jgi:hypothetical protein